MANNIDQNFRTWTRYGFAALQSPQIQAALSLAASLSSWNLKYHAFPNVSDELDGFWDLPYGREQIENYLGRIMAERADAYWGVAPSPTAADRRKEAFQQLRNVIADLIGDGLVAVTTKLRPCEAVEYDEDGARHCAELSAFKVIARVNVYGRRWSTLTPVGSEYRTTWCCARCLNVELDSAVSAVVFDIESGAVYTRYQSRRGRR